ncbi:MAG: TonB-dependent receptor [Cystobacterineae bacterium]|nr:TonB-dependent receptor [Cystobacterineae bacterium]
MHHTLLRWARWALLAFVAQAGVAWAQSSSVFVGTVRDALNKEPVSDVIVIVTAPEKLGEEIVVTDDTGSYRVSQLPPGTYKLRFEKENYRSFEREGVLLDSHKTLRVNIEMAPSAIDAEEEVVVGRTPVIDVGSATVGMVANEEFFRKIPLTRPAYNFSGATVFDAAAEATPGVRNDALGYSIAGTTSPENAVFVDGLSVANPGTGVLGTFFSAEFMQDVSVISGGFMPEYGRTTGGIISGTTKSGSNELRGSIFSTFSPGFLTGNRQSIDNLASQYGSRNKLLYSGEFGFDLGGPIIKDKLWFYVGFAPSMVKYNINTWYSRFDSERSTEDFPVFERLQSSVRDHQRADNRTYSYIAKLSYQPASNHNLSLQIFGAPSEAGGYGRWPAALGDWSFPYGAYQDSITMGRVQEDSRDLLLKYAGSFWNKQFLVDAHLGWHHQRNRFFPDDNSKIGATSGMSSQPQVWVNEDIEMTRLAEWGHIYLSEDDRRLCQNNPGTCVVDGFWFGGIAPSDTKLDRVSAKAMGTLLFQAAGHHVMKAGLNVDFLLMDSLYAIPGGRDVRGTYGHDGTDYYYYYYDAYRYGVLIGPDYFREDPYSRSQPKSLTYGAFIQDSWSIFDKVTLNVGVRWDQQQLYDSSNKLALVIANQWSPRAGLVYDFMQNGKSKIFANYARLYETVPLSIIENSFPGRRRGGYYYYNPSDCDFANEDVREAFGRCVRAENRYSMSGGAPNPSQYAFAANNQSTLVDPNLKAQSTDEIVAGIEYEVFDNASLGFSYTRRYMNHVIEDMSRDDGYTYFIGNPGDGIAKEFPKAVRNYNAFTLNFRKVFSGLWFAQASYTYATLKGNYSGLFKPETSELNPNATTDFDYLVLSANRNGYLPLDLRHNIRAQVAKEFELSKKMSLGLSLSYYGISGAPTNAFGTYKDNWGQVFITPRASGERLPWQHSINAGLKFNVRLDKERVLSIGGTVFNVFNFKAVTSIDEQFTYYNVFPSGAKTPGDICFADTCTADNPNALRGTDGEVLPSSVKNKNFGRPTSYQVPISARLEARVTF